MSLQQPDSHPSPGDSRWPAPATPQTPDGDGRLADLYYQVRTSDPDARVVVQSGGYAKANFLFRADRFLEAAAPLSVKVLAFLLNKVNVRRLRKTGRLFSWPSIETLANKCDRNPGHIRRALKELREIGLVQVVRLGRQGSTPTYELVIPEGGRPRASGMGGRQSGGPAAQKVARRRASGCALARRKMRASAPLTKEIELGREAAASSLPPSPLPSSSQTTTTVPAVAAVVSAGAGEEGAGRQALLAAEGFDADAIEQLLAHPNCTAGQIRTAAALANRQGKFRVSRQAFMRRAIEKKYAPPLTVEQRREAAQPEHVQFDDSARHERQAAAAAAEARDEHQLRGLLAGLPASEIDDRLRGLAESQPHGFMAVRLRQLVGRPLAQIPPMYLSALWEAKPVKRSIDSATEGGKS
jgi:hypothetical protein